MIHEAFLGPSTKTRHIITFFISHKPSQIYVKANIKKVQLYYLITFFTADVI
jgi:hypothetical protein